jgi:hypothetical protein
MFGRFRLVRRTAPWKSRWSQRSAAPDGRSVSDSVPIPAHNPALKSLVSSVLAHPLDWTNPLPMSDTRGRAANSVVVGGGTDSARSLTARTGRVPSADVTSSHEGGAQWPTFADPH